MVLKVHSGGHIDHAFISSSHRHENQKLFIQLELCKMYKQPSFPVCFCWHACELWDHSWT